MWYFVGVVILGICMWKIKIGKKYISLVLSIITIIICCWLIVDRLKFLDVPSNKNDTYAMWEKKEILERTDIDECEKKVLIERVEQQRERKRHYSAIAFQTQITLLVIGVIQLMQFILILSIPKKTIQSK